MENKNFKDLGLSNNVLKAIEKLGFHTPSKIQDKVIPFIMDGFDVIGQAQTGTGKTLAYASSILSKMNKSKGVKAVILTPTRELALQVSKEFDSLNNNDLNVLAIFGGSSLEKQITALKKGVDVVVGTPGRIMDLIDRKVLKIDGLEYFVLDEADEMLNMGFLEDIEYIFKKTNEEKQVLLFSATMPKTILSLAKKYMKSDYQHISIEEVTKTSINVKQTYYLVNDKTRVEALCRVIDAKNPKLTIIFCKTKSSVDGLLTELSKRGYSAEAMHGDIIQSMRIQTLERFKSGSFNILIATDVAARGIHVDNIELVVNYHIPGDTESYVHRIGRTGRANSKGEAISFVSPREVRFIDEVARFAKCDIEKGTLPSINTIINVKYNETVAKSLEAEVDAKAVAYVNELSKEDLVKLSANLLKASVFEKLGSEEDIDLEVNDKRGDRNRGSRDNSSRGTSGTTRVFLTIGKMDNLKRGTLLDFLKKETGINKDSFQNIEILTKFTFMNVRDEDVKLAMKKLTGKKLNNRVIRVERAKK